MQLPQFTELHATQLSTFLDTQPEAMTLSQSQGYLFGVICSPEPLDVHEWIAQILPNTTDNLDEEVLFLFMALYHQISEQVFEIGYKLPTQYSFDFCKSWSEGFLTATTTYTQKLLTSEQLEAEYKDALESAQATLSFFALGEDAITTIAAQNNLGLQSLCLQQYELMGDFALGFAELIEIVALNSGLYTDEGWDE
ncbi:UPF0149 family protein [Pseudoalteromonas sp.]|jgi:uncharacterized protein YecA (UPF0149 family)|uniref:UPF0149 family protein n=1 Tax=Pseudoalteromonas sp. TaxID=53249 RepID=UPI0023529E2F|nr:UPF0149 family protein [Pseudoalteromonas sp.]